MLTIQFIPRIEFQNLSSPKRISKILKLVHENKMVLLEGRLESHEEAELIRKTMEGLSEKFHGIELAVLDYNKDGVSDKVRSFFAKLLLGARMGITLIGPANIVKEIKRDPEKMQVFIKDRKK